LPPKAKTQINSHLETSYGELIPIALIYWSTFWSGKMVNDKALIAGCGNWANAVLIGFDGDKISNL
jgi:hypothetical protein